MSRQSPHRRVRIHPDFVDHPALATLLAQIDDYQRWSVAPPMKNDHAATVVTVRVGESVFVVKAYHPRSGIKGISRALRPSKAWASWRAAQWLHAAGVSTVTPIALVENRHWSLTGRAFLITDYLPGTNARSFFNDSGRSDQDKQAAAGQIVDTVATLHRNGLAHGDTKDSNFLIDDGTTHVLDLDAVRRPRLPWRRRRGYARDWRILRRNWQQNPPVQCWFDALIREREAEEKR
ncbi:MAG: serine/threonine-protein kinase [Pseudomonadota bacterium]|nr:serine/threonine-protein kinase [Pseudomonadota bacterium]